MGTATYKRRGGEVHATQVESWSDVRTLAGRVTAAPGDYIVLDAEGQPADVIEREVFEAAYEPVTYELVAPAEVAPPPHEEGLPPTPQPVSPAESPAPPVAEPPPAEAGPV